MLSALRQHSSAFHADALQPVVNASDCEAVAALSQLARGLTERGPGPVEAMAGALNQMAAATSESAQVLAFCDCYLATALTCLALMPAGQPVPSGKRDRSNFTDRLKAALTLFR